MYIRSRRRGAEMRRFRFFHHAAGETNNATGTQNPKLNTFTRQQIAATMRLRCEKAFPRRPAVFIFSPTNAHVQLRIFPTIKKGWGRQWGEMASQLRERCGNDFRRPPRSVTPSPADVSIDEIKVPQREFQPLLLAQPAK